MKLYLFSRKFLFPFFILFIVHLGYFSWEFWKLYGNDFDKKGIPSSLVYRFIWGKLHNGPFFQVFLHSFLAATAFYYHQTKKKGKYNPPFSIREWTAVTVLLLLSYYYIAYVEPRNVTRSRYTLSAIVFYRPGEKLMIDENFGDKDAKMMLPSELGEARRNIIEEETIGVDKYPLPFSKSRRYEWEIVHNFVYPIQLLLFYILGVLLGLTLRKTYAVWIFVITYFLVFLSWVYFNRFFEALYKIDRVNLLIGSAATSVVLVVLIIPWYMLLRKKGVLIDEDQQALDELLTRENS